jgi:hypothetical protein
MLSMALFRLPLVPPEEALCEEAWGVLSVVLWFVSWV